MTTWVVSAGRADCSHRPVWYAVRWCQIALLQVLVEKMMKVKVIECMVNLPLGAQSLGQVLETRMNEWLAAHPGAQVHQVLASPLTIGAFDPATGNLSGMLGTMTYIFYDE